MAKKATAKKAVKKTAKATPKRAKKASAVKQKLKRISSNKPESKMRRYVNAIPKSIPKGKILCHNNVQPAHPINRNGFRVWLDDSSDHYERPKCGWGDGIEHYRVKPSILHPNSIE